jgi:hypothetical protein
MRSLIAPFIPWKTGWSKFDATCADNSLMFLIVHVQTHVDQAQSVNCTAWLHMQPTLPAWLKRPLRRENRSSPTYYWEGGRGEQKNRCYYSYWQELRCAVLVARAACVFCVTLRRVIFRMLRRVGWLSFATVEGESRELTEAREQSEYQ